MLNIKQNLLYVLLVLVFFKPLAAAESWYETAAKLYKEWAKTEEKLEALLLKDK